MKELNSNEIKNRMEKAVDSFKKDLVDLELEEHLHQCDQINVSAYEVQCL